MSLRSRQRRPIYPGSAAPTERRQRDPRALVLWNDEARHLSADDDDPDPFWRYDFPAIVAILVIAAGTFLAIYLTTGRL